MTAAARRLGAAALWLSLAHGSCFRRGGSPAGQRGLVAQG